MNYIIPPRSKASDLTKGKLTQDEIISLQIANDKVIADARKAIKFGEIQQPTQLETSSPQELIADDARQESNALTNLMRLGFRPQEASAIISRIRTDPDINFITLNANYPSIETDIQKRFNPKLLTPSFFIEYLRKYSDELLGARGVRVFNPNSSSRFNNLINTSAELRQVIPSAEMVRQIRTSLPSGTGMFDSAIFDSLTMLERLLPTSRDFEEIDRLEPVSQQRAIERILTSFSSVPTPAELQTTSSRIGRGSLSRGVLAEISKLSQSVSSSTPSVSSILSSGVYGVPAGGARVPAGGRREVIIQSSSSSEQSSEQSSRQSNPRTPQSPATKARVNLQAAEAEIQAASDEANRQLQEIQRRSRSRSSSIGTTAASMTTAAAFTPQPISTKITYEDLQRELEKPSITLQLQIIKGEKAGERVGSVQYIRKNPPKKGETYPNSRYVWIGDTNVKDILNKEGNYTYEELFGKIGLGIGSGIKPTPKKKMMVGKGLSVKQTPSYIQYGKYAIHLPQLEQQDILNVKYKSLGNIPKYKPIAISDVFRDFILDLLDNGKGNPRVYNQIENAERKYFEEMSMGAGVWSSLGLERTTTSNDEQERNRFEILKGEYLAGNNSPKLITELKRLLIKMMSDGRIKKSQGTELLIELSL
jgi:hypothetical protein